MGLESLFCTKQKRSLTRTDRIPSLLMEKSPKTKIDGFENDGNFYDLFFSCHEVVTKHMRGWRGGGRTDPKIHHRVNDGMIWHDEFDILFPNTCWE